MSNPTPLTHGELKQIFDAYLLAVNSQALLAAREVEQALTERTALLSGIAHAYTTSSDNPRANTVALKLQNEIRHQYPDIDSGVIASILSQAFTEAARLCTPLQQPLDAEALNALRASLVENHVNFLELNLRRLGSDSNRIDLDVGTPSLDHT